MADNLPEEERILVLPGESYIPVNFEAEKKMNISSTSIR